MPSLSTVSTRSERGAHYVICAKIVGHAPPSKDPESGSFSFAAGLSKYKQQFVSGFGGH